MNIRRILASIIATALLIPAGSAYAAVIVFQLESHPGGNVSPPPYGLRLDGLFDGNTNEEWTFDFSDPQSDMKMWVDTIANTITIAGQAYGGRDAGAGYDPILSGVWDISFVYSTNVMIDTSNPPWLDIESSPEAPLDNNGSITPLFNAVAGGFNIVAGVAIALEQEKEFYFNNIEDHRLDGSGLSGPETYVGWGWLNSGDSPHIDASDWLFTATVIPVPAAVWLFGSALGLLGWLRRKA